MKICLLSVLLIVSGWFGYYRIHPAHTQKVANIENQQVDIDRRIAPVFSPHATDNIALIMMVKDEEDVIFENLLWHFCLGFRKFVVVDNNSSDHTRALINDFANLTKNHAVVLILEDPIMEYIQARVTNGAYQLAKSVWPEVEWVFPVDADEFWWPEQHIEAALAQIPPEYNAISVLRMNHSPAEDYYHFSRDVPFYEKIHFRSKSLGATYKAAVRVTDKNIWIGQGNHSVYEQPMKGQKILRMLNFIRKMEYASGNKIGIHMTEFHMRSIAQTHKKLSNGMRANLAAKEKHIIAPGMGDHWNQYQDDLQQYHDKAAQKRFESTFVSSNLMVDDPLPIKEAKKFFYNILAH